MKLSFALVLAFHLQSNGVYAWDGDGLCRKEAKITTISHYYAHCKKLKKCVYAHVDDSIILLIFFHIPLVTTNITVDIW